MSDTQDVERLLRSVREENERLKRAVEELSVLNDLARAIGASLNSQEIMQTIIHRSLRSVHAEQGVITLVEQRQSEPMKTLVRSMVSSAARQPYHLTQAFTGWMYLNKRPLIVNDPQHDERFRRVRWDESIRSILCVPMMVKSELIGVLAVFNKRAGGRFSEDDQRMLSIIAVQSGQVVENARLYEEEKLLRQMEEELKLASRIQSDLLPKDLPRIRGYDVAGRTIPAKQVGGDYFDFVSIDKVRTGVCLGDVSGKGLPASLLMANLQATLRGQVLPASRPMECLERANRLLFQSTSPEKFATLFFGVLDAGEHLLSYVNAGHEHPILLSAGGNFVQLEKGGFPLGLLEGSQYEEGCVEVSAGDVLVIYSDGISESMNADNELFGEERTVEIVRQHRHLGAADILEKVLEGARQFAGGRPQSDDMTLVVIKRE